MQRIATLEYEKKLHHSHPLGVSIIVGWGSFWDGEKSRSR